MQKLTIEQAVIIMGYTGTVIARFSDFHKDVEKRIGRPVFTHEFGNKDMEKQIKELYKEDFLKLMPDEYL